MTSPTNFFSWFQDVADLLLVRNISGWTGGGRATGR